MRIKVKVKTNASRNEIKKLGNDSYEVKVTSAPEKGKANEKIRELLSRHFNVPKSRISIIHGRNFREKIVEILDL